VNVAYISEEVPKERLYLSEKASSAHNLLHNHIARSLDQVQGFSTLFLKGQVDREVDRPLQAAKDISEKIPKEDLELKSQPPAKRQGRILRNLRHQVFGV
jgi:hypothetical protein